MIWIAGEADVPDVVAMGQEFHARAKLPGEFRLDEFATFMRGLMLSGVVLRSEGGLICGLVLPLPYNSSYGVASEVFWFAKDGNGVRLLRRFEEWARRQSAREVRLTTQTSLPGAERALRNYTQAENGYVRTLT